MRRITILFASVLLLSGCYKETQPKIGDIFLKYTATPNPAPADGMTQVAIVAEIPGETTSDKYNLNFSTTFGTFYDTQKSSTIITSQRPSTDGNRVATALLVCPNTIGSAIVTVSSQDISTSLTVNFQEAFPDSVKLNIDKQFITSDITSEAALTFNMTRKVGIPTIGTQAVITAKDGLGDTIGNFRDGTQAKSNAAGTATFYFSPDKSTYLGIITITASVPGTTLNDVQHLTIYK